MSTGLTSSQVSLLFRKLQMFLNYDEIKHRFRNLVSLIHRELANVELAKVLLTLAFQALLLLKVFELSSRGTGFEGFGVFPNRQRPRCTTMPWILWPSLAVLWGVCWMFYDPLSDWALLPFDNYIEEEQPFLFHSYFSFDPGLTSPIHTIGHEAGDLALGYGFEENMFAGYMHDFSSTDLSTFSLQQSSQASDVAGMTPLPDYSNAYLSAASLQVPTPRTCALGIGSHRSSSPSHTLNNADEPVFANSYTIKLAQTAQLTPPTSHHTLSLSPAPQPPHPTPTPTPQKNSEGKYHCTLCTTSETWKWLSGWKTHTAKHTRPFQCPAPTCLYTSATKAVLDRHVLRVHKQEHISPSRTESETPSVNVQMNEESVRVEKVSVQEDGRRGSKRHFLNDDDKTETPQQQEKRMRSEATDGCVGAYVCEYQDFLTKDRENELLRREVDRLRHEIDKLKEELTRAL